jgi:hypothetical protein
MSNNKNIDTVTKLKKIEKDMSSIKNYVMDLKHNVKKKIKNTTNKHKKSEIIDEYRSKLKKINLKQKYTDLNKKRKMLQLSITTEDQIDGTTFNALTTTTKTDISHGNKLNNLLNDYMSSKTNTDSTRGKKINRMLDGYDSDNTNKHKTNDELNNMIRNLINNKVSKHINDNERDVVTNMAYDVLNKNIVDSISSSSSSLIDSSLTDSSSLNDVCKVVLSKTDQQNIISLYNKLLALKQALS